MFRRKSVAKGLAAGAVGGLVGTIVMTQFQNACQKASPRTKPQEQSQANDLRSADQSDEFWRTETGTEGAPARSAKVYSVRQSGAEAESRAKDEPGDDATAKVAGAIARVGGKHLARDQKKKGGTIVHYAFGTLMGAAYGIATELGTRRIRKSTVLSGLGFGAALFAGAGFEVLHRLKADERTAGIPVIIHTSKVLDARDRDLLSSATAIVSKESKSHDLSFGNFAEAFSRAGFPLTMKPGKEVHHV